MRSGGIDIECSVQSLNDQNFVLLITIDGMTTETEAMFISEWVRKLIAEHKVEVAELLSRKAPILKVVQ